MSAGIYLHIPFCKSRCSYCDFATDVYRSADAVERYVSALCREISASSISNERTTPSAKLGHPSFVRRGLSPVDTIYLGGGTPSLLSPAQMEQILNAVAVKFDVADDAEITVEMNPATVTADTLAGYRSLGVNRASFGLQTFDDRDLSLLARGHNADDARNTFRFLREAGFDNISFDLIAGLPGQTVDNWRRNLDEALALRPEHLSLYLLEVHEGTPLAEQIRSGRRPVPDNELAAEMYEIMIDKLTNAGYAQYEISNFSKPGFESRHNSKYWRLDPVLGFGVSAHSFDGIERYANERDTAKYVSLVEAGDNLEISREKIDGASEFAFLGLRLSEGIDLKAYREKFGIDLERKYLNEIAQAEENGLVERRNGDLRLTRRGMLYSNEVFSIFV